MTIGTPARTLLCVVCLGLAAIAGFVSAGSATGDVARPTDGFETGEWAGGSLDPDAVACPARAAEITDRPATSPDEPRIVELYPDPVARGNVGEFFVVEYPSGRAGANVTVTDGYRSATVTLADPTAEERDGGRLAVTTDADATRELTDEPVVELDGHLRLAADGDELALRNGSTTIDAVAYDRAPEGSVWYRNAGDEVDSMPDGSDELMPDGSDESMPGRAGSVARGEWWPRDATCRPPTSVGPVDDATAFVLPDSPGVPLEFLEDADDRIRLAGYTFTDGAVASALVDAVDRGVTVDVLLEADPVGGTPEATRPLLDELVAAGVSVRVLGDEGARYAFHHPKYAVADDRVLVTTENWKPSGVGGGSSRGWGTVVEDAALAADLAAVFDADHAGHDTTPWREHRERASFVEDDGPAGAFPERISAESVDVDAVELLLAPDNAEDRLVEVLRSAEESILIEQVRIEDPDFVLLEEVVAAARRGVDVRILLDGSWYVADENRAIADRLQAVADDENIPLEVRVAGRSDRFEKVHAKGIVVDGETAVVGSLNWNENSLRNNREVALVLHGTEAAGFYADVFEADWDGDGTWPLPIELVGIVVGALVLAGLAGRRYVRFGPARPDSTGSGERPLPVTIEPVRSAGREPDRPGGREPDRPGGRGLDRPGGRKPDLPGGCEPGEREVKDRLNDSEPVQNGTGRS